MSGADCLLATSCHIKALWLRDTPVTAPHTQPVTQGAQFILGWERFFFLPSQGVKTVFLVQTTLFDAGPSS